MTHRTDVTYVSFYEGAAIIVNGKIVYTEDDDKGYHQNFTAERVGEALAIALGVPLRKVELPDEIVPVDYDFDVIAKLAAEVEA